MKITPDKMLKMTKEYAKNLEILKKKKIFVGLPKKTSSKVYSGGSSVLEVGAAHEYGVSGVLPRRSFLRVPFALKKQELAHVIANEIKDMLKNGDPIKVLNIIGVTAQNISQGAFITKGYGTWQDIKEETKDNKGSSGVLVDQGTLKNSITWVIK